jgi:glycosyltransferase involved in cell wall biosynthesis
VTVASYLSPWVTLERIAGNSRVLLTGPVFKLTPLYDSHRVMVAPARFSTGIPYKVYEAASFGVPIVTTSLLCEQMGWTDDRELLAADADDAPGFAARVVALYRSEVLWERLRQAAMSRLRRDNGRDAYAQKIRAVLPAHDSGDHGGVPLTPHRLQPARRATNRLGHRPDSRACRH